MTLMPEADRLIEQVYDEIFKRCPAEDRVDVARITLLAAQYRINLLQQKRTARAIARVSAERRALRTQQPDGNAPVCLQGAPAGQQEHGQ